MLKSELLNLINAMEDTQDIDDILKETDLYKSSSTLDNVKPLFETNEGFKKFLESEKDKHYSKALETWKNNNLDKLVQAEILKSNPNKTPLELRIEAMEKERAEDKKALAKANMTNKFKDTLNEKKIPSNLLDFMLADDEETTLANITIFEDIIKRSVESGVSERIKGGSYVPPKGAVDTGMTKEKFLKLNLGEQAKLAVEDKDLYTKLTE